MDSQTYAETYVRLRGRRLVFAANLSPPKVRYPRPLDCSDPVPYQHGRVRSGIVRIGGAAEAIAIRRALSIFARSRSANPKGNSIKQIQVATAAAFKVDLMQMLSRTLCRGITRIRQIAMMLAMTVCAHSRRAISRRFDRDHSTVFYAEKKYKYLLDGVSSSSMR